MLHVTRVGSGQPIVFTHGLGDDGRTWDAVASILAVSHSVVTWDLRGHGQSSATPDTRYSRELAIGDLEGIIDSFDTPVDLVGHSLGGYLSLAFALLQPERVVSLTMIASGPGYRDPKARAEWNRYVDLSARKMPIPPEASALCHQGDSSVIDHVSELRAPLLLLVGDRDRRFHAGMAYMADRVAGSVLVHIDGAGHHPQQTHPEVIAHHVDRHLSRTREQSET